jgi:hypothetical protein
LEIRLVHALPGRVRLQSSRLKGNPSLAQEIAGQLQAVPAITGVTASAVTGSLLLFSDPGRALTKNTIRQLAGVLKILAPGVSSVEVAGWLKPGAVASSQPPPLAGSIADFFGAVNAAVSRAFGGLDLKVLVPASLFLLGIRGMISEKATPPAWYNLLWFALSTFMMFHPARTPVLAETEILNATLEGVAELGSAD